MPRKRTDPKTNWLPPRVYKGKSAYEFRPKGGGCIRLCGLDAPRSTVYKQYERHAHEDLAITVSGLVTEYFDSADYQDKSEHTRSDYLKNAKNINKVFGRMLPDSVKPFHVRQYMDKRGKKSRVQANREHSFFRVVFSWAYERGLVKTNPCKGVRQFTEKNRDRYITDAEYSALYDLAPDHVKVAMEISYLCAARISDVLKLKWTDVKRDGVFIQQGKTGKKQIKAWTNRLEDALRNAKRLCKLPNTTAFVVCQTNGKQYSYDGFRTGWKKAMDALKETGMDTDFTFHDIKAKSISDFEGSVRDKQRFSGHKTEAQVNAYDRKVEVVPSLNKQ